MFGLWRECPEDVEVAWGARAIVEKNRGHYNVSLLWDRQSWKGSGGEREKFGSKLNAGILQSSLKKAKKLLRSCEMDTAVAGLHVLHDKNGVKILGDTSGSCGYLYLIAFPTE